MTTAVTVNAAAAGRLDRMILTITRQEIIRTAVTISTAASAANGIAPTGPLTR